MLGFGRNKNQSCSLLAVRSVAGNEVRVVAGFERRGASFFYRLSLLRRVASVGYAE